MKAKLIYILKVLVGLFLVIWIISQIDRQKFYEYFLQLNIWLLLLVIPLSLGSLYIQFMRWKYMVSRYSNDYNDMDLLPSFFAGFAFRLMIPGGHAELSKIFLLPGKKRGKFAAFGMERVFQTMIKVVLAVGLLTVHFPQYTYWFLLIIIGFVSGYFILPKIKLIQKLYEKPVNYHTVFFWSLVFSAGVYTGMLLQYYILLRNAYPVSFSATAYAVVYLWSAGTIPISISGLGVREGFAVYFFNLYGVPGAYAVATSLFLFAINAIGPALVGAYFIYKKRAYLKDIKATLKSTKEIVKSLRNNNNEDISP